MAAEARQLGGSKPPAQLPPLPLDTPEGARPLSQSTWAQRWRRARDFSKGGFLTSPLFPHGGSVSAVTSLRPLRAAVVVAYVLPAAFGAALLRIPGSPLLRLLVFFYSVLLFAVSQPETP